MKRSSVLLIVIMSLCILAPIVFIGIVYNDVKNNIGNLTEWAGEYLDIDENAGVYKISISSTSDRAVPDCYINVTTYKSNIGNEQYVHMVNPVTGVDVRQENQHIIVELDSVCDMEGDGLILTLELPQNSVLKVENSISSVDLNVNNADINRMMLVSSSDFKADNSNIGGVISVEQLATKAFDFDGCNVGVIQFNGDNCALSIDNSNVGAMTISGDCHTIALSNSNIGVCSWSSACADVAVVEDCEITTTTVDNNLFKITVDDIDFDADEDVAVKIDTTAINMSVRSGSDRVDISPSGVHITGDDGEVVKVSIDGVHIDSEDTKVDISPAGVRVVEDGEEVVSVGVGGIKVK